MPRSTPTPAKDGHDRYEPYTAALASIRRAMDHVGAVPVPCSHFDREREDILLQLSERHSELARLMSNAELEGAVTHGPTTGKEA